MRKTKLLLVAFLAMVGLSSFAKVYEFDQKLQSSGLFELCGRLIQILNVNRHYRLLS